MFLSSLWCCPVYGLDMLFILIISQRRGFHLSFCFCLFRLYVVNPLLPQAFLNLTVLARLRLFMSNAFFDLLDSLLLPSFYKTSLKKNILLLIMRPTVQYFAPADCFLCPPLNITKSELSQARTWGPVLDVPLPSLLPVC